MPALDTPNEVAPETVHANLEPSARKQVHVGDEEIILALKEEEGSVTVRSEPISVFLHEILDLILSETQFVQIGI